MTSSREVIFTSTHVNVRVFTREWNDVTLQSFLFLEVELANLCT